MAHNTELPKRIHLKGEGHHEEARAGAAITPGMLLLVNNVGAVIPHNVAGGHAEKHFALEDALQGRTIETAYAVDELVMIVMAQPTDMVYAFLDAGETAEIGDFLSSDGTGRLKVATSTDQRLAIAMEAVDLSDSEAENSRIKVRII